LRINEVETAVRAALQPVSLLVLDESHLHRGHAGARPYGQSHYKVIAVSTMFEGKSRVERQRLVHAALGSAVGDSIHALSMTLLTPEQAA
jgi:BolA family transcriptional regulator, general stress-responsive regulator